MENEEIVFDIESENNIYCLKCRLWDKAAKESGFACGMCEDCFNKNFIKVDLSFELKKDMENEKIKITARIQKDHEIANQMTKMLVWLIENPKSSPSDFVNEFI